MEIKFKPFDNYVLENVKYFKVGFAKMPRSIETEFGAQLCPFCGNKMEFLENNPTSVSYSNNCTCKDWKKFCEEVYKAKDKLCKVQEEINKSLKPYVKKMETTVSQLWKESSMKSVLEEKNKKEKLIDDLYNDIVSESRDSSSDTKLYKEEYLEDLSCL